MSPGDDDTVRVPPRPQRRGIGRVVLATAIVALASSSLIGWWLWPSAPLPTAPQVITAPAPTAPAPKFPIETATERQIREDVPGSLTIFRFSANPLILVLDFASLHQQGMMFNRVAALVEKSGLPRDRVLTDSELDQAIRAHGDTFDTYYYGHDYSVAALERFFGLADRDHLELNTEEEKLRELLRQEGWLDPEQQAALISLPAVGANASVTAAARMAILRHELSHGEFFSKPTYAAYVRGFWLNSLTENERGGVRGFLRREGYDSSQEELMYNEMQAYLMFTRDPNIFTPAMVGLTPDRLRELQKKFLDAMPPGWLHDVLAEYQ